MRPTREQLANMLPEHGEADLAERVLSITDAELERIGDLGGYYAWSEEALELLGGSMGGTSALPGSPRALAQTPCYHRRPAPFRRLTAHSTQCCFDRRPSRKAAHRRLIVSR